MSGTNKRDAIRERHLQAHSDALDGLVIDPWIDGQSVSYE